MAAIEKIVHRADGKICVWITPKLEVEFNDLGHLRAWASDRPTSLDDAAVKRLLLKLAERATKPADMVRATRLAVDVVKVVDDATGVR